MEAFDDIGFESFSLFLVWVLVLICDEISVCAMEGEHQAMKFTVGGDWDLEVRVAEQFSEFESFLQGWGLLDLSGEWGCVDGHDGHVLLVNGARFGGGLSASVF